MISNETAELTPCPFERGTCDPECLDIVVETDSSQRPGVFHGYVKCEDCGARGPEAWADEDSIRATAAFGWNDRIARTPADGPEPVAVKVLEWMKSGGRGVSYRATSIGLRYHIYSGVDDTLWHGFIEGYQPVVFEPCVDIEAAKAAAQADYEQRIRSAITHPVPADGPADAVSEAEVEAAAQGYFRQQHILKGFVPPWDSQPVDLQNIYRSCVRAALEAAQRARK